MRSFRLLIKNYENCLNYLCTNGMEENTLFSILFSKEKNSCVILWLYKNCLFNCHADNGRNYSSNTAPQGHVSKEKNEVQ